MTNTGFKLFDQYIHKTNLLAYARKPRTYLSDVALAKSEVRG